MQNKIASQPAAHSANRRSTSAVRGAQDVENCAVKVLSSLQLQHRSLQFAGSPRFHGCTVGNGRAEFGVAGLAEFGKRLTYLVSIARIFLRYPIDLQ
jgi:hypothetical protein